MAESYENLLDLPEDRPFGRKLPFALKVGALAVGVGAITHWIKTRREMNFQGRVVLITGGSRGLGLILAHQLAAQGARIAICARDSEELERAKSELVSEGTPADEILTVVCDVAHGAEVERMVHQVVRYFGGLDILVNSASIIQVGPLETMSEEDFRDAMEVNFWGTFHSCMAAIPHLRKSDDRQGRIVNITSIGGVVAVPHLLPYTCAKFATVGFSQGLQAELAKDGIRVVTVVPGLMRTGSFMNALFKGKEKFEFRWFSAAARVPLLSMDAEKAAHRILEACRFGDPFITLGIPAKALRWINAFAPGPTGTLHGLINRVLPTAISERDRERGARLGRTQAGKRIRSADRYNEMAG